MLAAGNLVELLVELTLALLRLFHLVGLLLQLTTQLGNLPLQGVDLLLQFSLQSQTGIEGALQQGNPIFQATGGHDGAVVAAKDNPTT